MANLINLGSELLRICPTSSNKIEASTNGGKTWSTRYSGSSYGAFYDLTSYGGEIIAVTSKGVYVSTNGGRSWSSRYTGSSPRDFMSLKMRVEVGANVVRKLFNVSSM